MAKTQDYTAVFKDFLGNLPVDTKAFEDVFKTNTALAERMSAVAIDAAQKSTELSAKWTNETLAGFAAVTKAKAEPTDYAKAAQDFATTSAEAAAQHVAAFAEIAKRVQTETFELIMAAGKTVAADVTKVATKAAK